MEKSMETEQPKEKCSLHILWLWLILLQSRHKIVSTFHLFRLPKKISVSFKYFPGFFIPFFSVVIKAYVIYDVKLFRRGEK
jgi:hypothetical protein